MGDEESFLEEDVAGGQDVETSERSSFLPALLLKILKWAAVAVAAIIFIVTVVYFTMQIMNRGTRPATVPAVSEEYRATPPVYRYVRDNFSEIRTRTADETPYTVIAQFGLGILESEDRLYDEIVSRTPQIQDLVRSYFTQKKAAEIMPKNEDAVKEEIRARVNAILTNGKIKDVILLEYNVLPL